MFPAVDQGLYGARGRGMDGVSRRDSAARLQRTAPGAWRMGHRACAWRLLSAASMQCARSGSLPPGRGSDTPSACCRRPGLPGPFGYSQDDVMQVLSNLFLAAELAFQSERPPEVALQLYREGAADFADCLHIAWATEVGEHPLWTFDRGAAKVVGAQLLRGRCARGRRKQLARPARLWPWPGQYCSMRSCGGLALKPRPAPSPPTG